LKCSAIIVRPDLAASAIGLPDASNARRDPAGQGRDRAQIHLLQVLKTQERLGGRMACKLASDATIQAINALHKRLC